jgi:hypothetical protein
MPNTLREVKSELRVAGNGQAFIAPVGTTLPAQFSDLASLNAAFKELGFITEDGAKLTIASTYQDKKAWQSFFTIRKIPQTKDFTVDFTLEQWDKLNVEFALNTTATSVSGGMKIKPNDPSVNDTRSMVLLWQDGSSSNGLVVPVGQISTDSIEVTLSRADTADLPVTFTATPDGIQDPWYIISNDAGLTSS